MMLDYTSYPESTLRRVMHPTRRVAMGVPEPLLRRYYRTAAQRKRAGEKNVQGAWFLPGDDPQWLELLPIEAALAVYRGVPPAVDRWNEVEQRKTRLAAYWAQVDKLPGADDPLWRWGTDGDDVGDDERYRMFDESNLQVEPWFPRLRLRLKYGTASLREYADRQGVHYPEG